MNRIYQSFRNELHTKTALSTVLRTQFIRSIIQVPRDAISISFVRSPGPGGQNVNKVNTKAEARDVKDRFVKQERNNINGDGEFVITANEERSQSRNREIVLQKIQERVNQAAVPPKERKLKTGGNETLQSLLEVNEKVKQKWVEDKRHRSEVKQRRKGKENMVEHF
ncbi:peptidyl-tRNA hydrolase mitochondrial [Blastocystis sp. subtype 4]|uniref:peptidyl-tRNA hydrolase mitochondrial n=1 Tax=Blastocystis sp. subtype 4 TaxID=944170 RepID=UPI0007121A64|nr:peptidyl-tRNA hydrolase mitochondrial [Blastocystis sp. subtype 4]KNB42386.1 peptidyl-tRNA hydrolase mitochondrial [Blastocystis sp. subtype 4]|eukprot:XP_014525829.1 peptidyl-tRNA hydrolase mitochondrial [Blastocystis sp. subtype 4]